MSPALPHSTPAGSPGHSSRLIQQLQHLAVSNPLLPQRLPRCKDLIYCGGCDLLSTFSFLFVSSLYWVNQKVHSGFSIQCYGNELFRRRNTSFRYYSLWLFSVPLKPHYQDLIPTAIRRVPFLPNTEPGTLVIKQANQTIHPSIVVSLHLVFTCYPSSSSVSIVRNWHTPVRSHTAPSDSPGPNQTLHLTLTPLFILRF